MARALNPENHPHTVRHPRSGLFAPKVPVHSGPGHIEQSSADDAASIPSVGLPITHFLASQGRG